MIVGQKKFGLSAQFFSRGAKKNFGPSGGMALSLT
jgi:hypothetical protein